MLWGRIFNFISVLAEWTVKLVAIRDMIGNLKFVRIKPKKWNDLLFGGFYSLRLNIQFRLFWSDFWPWHIYIAKYGLKCFGVQIFWVQRYLQKWTVNFMLQDFQRAKELIFWSKSMELFFQLHKEITVIQSRTENKRL